MFTAIVGNKVINIALRTSVIMANSGVAIMGETQSQGAVYQTRKQENTGYQYHCSNGQVLYTRHVYCNRVNMSDASRLIQCFSFLTKSISK